MSDDKCSMACNCNPKKKAGNTHEQNSNSQRYINGGRCPLKAYSLTCSDYGSPCLDSHRESKNCRTRKVFRVYK
ncbi:hypothetical protein JTE90_022006 [Oedothorax gibbosus]|uniref:Uncharacterized protein n=1 Tax=Oedothorax gibbosus TaxID=931172 RepID=A0AAV6V399_9ARAC|nr:hypothetical protein JTE90_022006 [Oedothorax gibbosus]